MDHKILQYIFDQKELNMHQRRWIELFSDYEYEIRYHPGKANVVADALSMKERVKPRRDEVRLLLLMFARFNLFRGEAELSIKGLQVQSKSEVLAAEFSMGSGPDASLHVPLDEINIDKTIRFVEEPVEIMDREVRSLKRSRISLVKFRWKSKLGLELTWEHEDLMRSKYPLLFDDRAVEPVS
ncbi:hypothetical protein Tco_0829328 [Tanacetum coccineum]